MKIDYHQDPLHVSECGILTHRDMEVIGIFSSNSSREIESYLDRGTTKCLNLVVSLEKKRENTPQKQKYKPVPGRFKMALLVISDMEGIPISELAWELKTKPTFLINLCEDDRFIPNEILLRLRLKYSLNLDYIFQDECRSVFILEDTDR